MMTIDDLVAAISTLQRSDLERWISEGASYDGGSPQRSLAELIRVTMLGAAPERYARALPIVATIASRQALCAASAEAPTRPWRAPKTGLKTLVISEGFRRHEACSSSLK